MSKEVKKGDSMFRDTLSLFLITVIAGLLLGGVYKLTKAPIDQATLEAKKESYRVVMPDAKDFEEQKELTKKLEAAKVEGCELNEIVVAKAEDGTDVGYAVLVTSKEGYGGDIQFSIGIDAEGTVQGVEIISMSETAGLGAKCTEDEFKGQYKGIQSEQLEVVKGEKSADNQISAISGATITSNAITNAVNQVLAFVNGLKG